LGPVFMFCAPGHVLGGTEGVASRFRRYRESRVPFSRFVRPESLSAAPRASTPVFMFCVPDSFLAVRRASAPVFMFCAPGLICSGTERVGCHYQVLRSRIHFRRYRGCRISFSCFARPDSFRWYRGRRVPFSCLAFPDSFSAVSRTHFRRY
jgi:hypothetical protein